MRRTGPYGVENFQLMAKLKEWVKQNGLWNNETTIFGIAWDDEATLPENCRYDVCLAVSQEFPVVGNLEKGEIPGGTYAVFTIAHTSEEVQQFWRTVLVEIEELGRTFDTTKPILERYKNKLVDAGFCEFCVPLIEATP